MISRHTLSAVLDDGTAFDITADQGANITLDEGWAPYVQVQLTIPTPPETYLVDPRENRRVRLVGRQLFGTSDPLSALSAEWSGKTLAGLGYSSFMDIADFTALHYHPWNTGPTSTRVRWFDLSIRSRSINRAAGTTAVTLASDEALLQDYANASETEVAPVSPLVRVLVNSVLTTIGATLTPSSAEVSAATVETPPPWTPGMTAWDYLQPLVQTAGLRLWCDERRQWHLDTVGANGTGTIVLNRTSTLTDSTEDIDRDSDWADAVVITYKWDDAAGVSHVRYDVAFTEHYSRVFALTHNVPYPGAGAASAILRRKLALGRTQECSAVSDYTATPGAACTVVSTNDGIVRNGYVSAVAWNWPSDEMSVRIRDITEGNTP